MCDMFKLQPKNPYTQKEDAMKKVTEFSQKVKGQETNIVLNKAAWVVGIDIGQKRLSCVLMNKAQTVLCRFNTEASLNGYEKILEQVKEKTKGRGKVVYAMEPTGHYWMVLGQFFEDNDQHYVLIHPLVVARSREVNRLNRSKTDPMDARLIGELACRRKVTRTQIPKNYWATLRFLAREYMDREKDCVREKLRITSYLETILPGFLEIFPTPLCLTGRACLHAFSNFKEALKGDFSSFEKRVRKHYTGKRFLVSRARRIYDTLRHTTAIGLRAGRDAMFCRIINSIERLEVYERQQETAERALLALYDQCEYKQYLNSIQGTTSTTNALVLGFIGNPTDYDHPKTLTKLAGCDPVLNESGKYKGETSISHRGRNLLRKASDRTAFLIEKRNIVFRNFFNRLVTRQKNRLTKRQARVACINKYFRIIWVLCNHRVLFNPALA
jgi:transposase